MWHNVLVTLKEKLKFWKWETIFGVLIVLLAGIVLKFSYAAELSRSSIGLNISIPGTLQVGDQSATIASSKMTRSFIGVQATDHAYIPSNNSPHFLHLYGGEWSGELTGTTEASNGFYQDVIPATGQFAWGYIPNAGSFTSTGMVNLLALRTSGGIELDGRMARSITVTEPQTTNTAGSNFTIQAGPAKSDSVDKNGGDLYVSSGMARGTGTSNIYFQSAGNGSTGNGGRNPDTRMTIAGSGNVGIGTTAPGEKFTVAGNVQIGDSSVSSAGQKLTRTSSGITATEHLFIPNNNSPRFERMWGGTWSGELTGTVDLANAAYEIVTMAPGSGTIGWGFVANTGAFTSSNIADVFTLSSSGYAQFSKTSTGTPTASDCDADAERGRLAIDTQNNRLYVCNGATRGWDYATLTD